MKTDSAIAGVIVVGFVLVAVGLLGTPRMLRTIGAVLSALASALEAFTDCFMLNFRRLLVGIKDYHDIRNIQRKKKAGLLVDDVGVVQGVRVEGINYNMFTDKLPRV